MEDIDELDESVKAMAGSAWGRLRITAPMSLGSEVVVPALLQFAKSYPNIEIDLSVSDRIVNLVDEGFDAAVRVGTPGSASMISRRLWEARVVLVAAPQYLETAKIPTHPNDLKELDCVLDTNFGDPYHWRFKEPKTHEPITVPVSGRLSFSGAEACLAAAEKGFGVSRVPSFMAVRKIQDGSLRHLLADFEEAPYPVYAVYPPGRHQAIKLRVFVDFLVAHFSDSSRWP
ncbi:substrate binding domain-containing protein (plasmid) [Rhizobium sp. CB3060]|uniref:substrate binding domain-containing protein n=1 Tax=Rhizobium sp. CB3060 TaxID=3138255 RepID=UPI0021A2F236|nr:substrate binding domain-containing protein [Rhizobium tropici]UWU26220.1 substrate binding domain-containing protein [Rhizobium tropici]